MDFVPRVLPSEAPAHDRKYRRSACQLEAVARRLETRTENRRIERIFEAVPDERRIIVFDVHIEFADVRRKEIHDRTVI